MGFFGKKAGEGSKKAGAPAPAPGISQSERPAEGAGSSSLSRAKTAAPGSLAGEGSGSGGDNMWLDSKPQARHTTYAPRQHSVDIDDDGLSPNKKGPHRVTNLTDEQLAKEQKARANTLRFKLSTPPTAEVEVTGIYSDRTYGAKGRPFSDGLTVLGRTHKKQQQLEEVEKEKEMKGGRLVWKDAEVKKKNLELMEAAPEEAASLASRPNFNGDWVCSAVSGEWDEFLNLLEVDEFTRKLAKARQWGKGFSEQKIYLPPDKSRIEIRNRAKKPCYTTFGDEAQEKGYVQGGEEDISESSPNASPAGTRSSEGYLVIKIDGKPQTLTYEEYTGKGTLAWEGKNLVTRMEIGTLGPAMMVRKMPSYGVMEVSLHVSHVIASRTFKLKDDYY